MRRFSEPEKCEVWDRWQGGESMRSIARGLGRGQASVRTMIEACGGVRPAGQRRAARHLSVEEREEISRGLSAGMSLRGIAPPGTLTITSSRTGPSRVWAERPFLRPRTIGDLFFREEQVDEVL